MRARRPSPLLVTGLPRSGTTWLARELSRAPGVALAGREPMNPRPGQFALSGTLTGWTRLADDAAPGQRRTLRRVYRGWDPRVYSRFGARQWRAPLPGTRLVVKDPFALLSLRYVASVTGARPVILFRHPGALLASYRRMGWRPATAEIRGLRLDTGAGTAPASPEKHHPEQGPDLAESMAWFWSTCYRTVLADLAELPTALLVDHAELARGGDAALRRLLDECGVRRAVLSPRQGAPRPRRGRVDHGGSRPVLHDFQRTVHDVAESWRESLTDREARTVARLTAETWSALRQRRLRLGSTTTEQTLDEVDAR